MNIKKIAEGKFLLVIKSMGIREEFSDNGEAYRAGFGYILGWGKGKDGEICLFLFSDTYNIMGTEKF